MKKKLFAAALLISMIFTGCQQNNFSEAFEPKTAVSETKTVSAATKFDVKSVPAYSGSASVEINQNKPYFSSRDKARTDAFENYSEIDSLSRCGVAYANICKELMPTEERGEIGSVKPSGWHTVKYNGYVEGNYLYNRCHLIGYQLAGENANEKNLITGTRYMNCDGQLPYENKVADYVKETGNHVLYRVTPIFEGKNMVASGVLTEAYSVEDKGKGCSFCVYCYNVQPGITIDYKTGDSHLTKNYSGEYATSSYYSKTTNYSSNNSKNQNKIKESSASDSTKKNTYILNTRSHKFHKPGCSGTNGMAKKNTKKVKMSRKEVVKKGYSPCGICNP